jgi:peptidoglycan LD-endopeptidase LytH
LADLAKPQTYALPLAILFLVAQQGFLTGARASQSAKDSQVRRLTQADGKSRQTETETEAKTKPKPKSEPGPNSKPKPKPKVELSSQARNAAIKELRARNLIVPIKNFDISRIKDSYNEMRGNQRHEASDMLAPRGTPILAVDDGTVAKLFLSRFGGITVYQMDPGKKYVYYYAHLDRYADGLHNDDRVVKGQVIGYVGTSGDAPKDTPHLHFSVSVLGPEKNWWQTEPLDPYEVFKK